MTVCLTLAFLWVSEVVDSRDRLSSALALSSFTHNRPSNTAASKAMGSSAAGFLQKWLRTFTSSGNVLVFCKIHNERKFNYCRKQTITQQQGPITQIGLQSICINRNTNVCKIFYLIFIWVGKKQKLVFIFLPYWHTVHFCHQS